MASGITTENLPKELPLDFLKKITNNFSEERLIGSGSFGSVYVGILDNNGRIAVKRLAEDSPVPRDEIFANEVRNIMVLEHENIVKLVGYCQEAQNRLVQSNGKHIVAEITDTLLCYEYLPYGGLDDRIFEYLYNGEISARSDIYSLGLTILEISTGEKNSSSTDQKHARTYINKVKQDLALQEIMSEYPDLGENGFDQIEACIEIGLQCVEIDDRKRPTIQEIVNMLNKLPMN